MPCLYNIFVFLSTTANDVVLVRKGAVVADEATIIEQLPRTRRLLHRTDQPDPARNWAISWRADGPAFNPEIMAQAETTISSSPSTGHTQISLEADEPERPVVASALGTDAGVMARCNRAQRTVGTI